jgi:hypothetical protein
MNHTSKRLSCSIMAAVVLPLLSLGDVSSTARGALLDGVKKVGTEGSSAARWLVCASNSCLL